MSDDDLMPEVNKQLVEEIKEEEAVATANDSEGEVDLSSKDAARPQKEMFKEIKLKISKEPKKIAPDVILQNAPRVKKKSYPHLERARAAALISKRENKKLRDEEKRVAKLQKKLDTAERKRAKNRERYWANKKEDKELDEIVAKKMADPDYKPKPAIKPAIKPKPVNIPTPAGMPAGMNFNDFEQHMDRYNLKKIKLLQEKQNARHRKKQQEEDAAELKKYREKKKNKSKSMISRSNVRGMYVKDVSYNDFFNY